MLNHQKVLEYLATHGVDLPFFSLASSFLPLALISGEFSSRSHQTNLELEERLSYVGTILDLNVGKSSVASCKE